MVQDLLRQEMVPALLDAGIAWHTRKGIRKDCLCTYCIEKRIGTAYIGRTPFPTTRFYALVLADDQARYHAGTGVPMHHIWYDRIDNDLAHEAVKQERARKREIVRADLRAAKETIF